MVKTNNISLYKRLYDLLIYGHISQTKISTLLKRDKAQISRMTNLLIECGYIECFNPRSRDHFYTATKKPFNAKELYKIPSTKSQRLHGVCNLVNIQRGSFKAKVLHPPRNGRKWEKEWDLCNGVHYQQYSQFFCNLGIVRFQRIVSSNKDIVKVVLPRITWNRDDGRPESFLYDSAVRCGKWFKKYFLIDFGNLVWCQKPDNALVLSDKHLISMAQHGTYSNGILSVDCSPPDKLPEIESKDYDLIDGLASLPNRVIVLESNVNRLVGSFSRIEKSIGRLESMLSMPVKPFDWGDVSYG